MEAKSYSAVRKELAKMMQQVCDDHEPLIITRKNKNAVVMMSLEDYNAVQESMYLLRSPENAKRLRQSIQEAAMGKSSPHDLIE